MSEQSGFTLIEALVAMAILAVAAAGLIGATEVHAKRINGLEARAAAGWVAQNHLAELHLTGKLENQPQTYRMLGREWQVSTINQSTSDPELMRVSIQVYAAGKSEPLDTLTGFIDIGRLQ